MSVFFKIFFVLIIIYLCVLAGEMYWTLWVEDHFGVVLT